MELSNILIPEAVKSVDGVASKKRLLQAVSDLAADAYGLDSGLVFDALQHRETLGPTGVGQGVAIPHARLEGLDRVIGVFYRLDKPVDFDSIDRMPVDLVFALFAPKESGVEHLKALALVSRTLRDTAARAKLRSSEINSALFSILTEATTSKAA